MVLDFPQTDIENRLMDMGRGEEGMGCMERVTWKLNITICKTDSQFISCMAQETQVGVLYQSTGGGWGGR